MAPAPLLARKLTYAEYDELERTSDEKHEYVRGEIFNMAGATPTHEALVIAVGSELRGLLRGRPCVVMGSSARVRIDDTDTDTYPDLTVICGRRRHAEGSRLATVNPILLVEVLSDSTEAWDRGGKFAHYRRLPSLQHYVLVSQHEHLVEVYTRETDGRWTLSEASSGEIALERLGIALSVDAIYDFPPDDPEELGAG
jgi:Uma2 family endonuclease